MVLKRDCGHQNVWLISASLCGCARFDQEYLPLQLIDKRRSPAYLNLKLTGSRDRFVHGS